MLSKLSNWIVLVTILAISGGCNYDLFPSILNMKTKTVKVKESVTIDNVYDHLKNKNSINSDDYNKNGDNIEIDLNKICGVKCGLMIYKSDATTITIDSWCSRDVTEDKYNKTVLPVVDLVAKKITAKYTN